MCISKLKFCLPFVFLIYIFSCAPEAPHSNPLDPELNNPGSKPAISGTVFTLYQPARPITNAAVQLKPGGEFELTDSNGFFQFSNLDAGDYQLIAMRESYQPDTIAVSITEGENAKEVNFFLNAVPQIRRMMFYSEHVDQWWPGEIYHAFLTIIVGDSDGVADIVSSTYSVPALNITKAFGPTARPDSFFVDIENLDLPQSNLQHLVEQPSFVSLTDEGGAALSGGPYFLRRIIEDAPQTLAPVNSQTVSSFPTLEWQALNLSFEFNYIAQVFRITAAIPVLIHTSPEIPAGQLSYNFPDSLTSGDYFWTIGVRDNLNNFSRSKEASFRVP
jgi:hypothetical protein